MIYSTHLYSIHVRHGKSEISQMMLLYIIKAHNFRSDFENDFRHHLIFNFFDLDFKNSQLEMTLNFNF